MFFIRTFRDVSGCSTTEFCSIKAGLRNAVPSPPWFGTALVQRFYQECAVSALWPSGNC